MVRTKENTMQMYPRCFNIFGYSGDSSLVSFCMMRNLEFPRHYGFTLVERITQVTLYTHAHTHKSIAHDVNGWSTKSAVTTGVCCYGFWGSVAGVDNTTMITDITHVCKHVCKYVSLGMMLS